MQVIPVDDPQPQVTYIFKNSDRSQIQEKLILCEPALDDGYETDTQSSAGASNSIERWVKGLESYQRSSFNFHIVVCILLILNIAVALHSTACRSESNWWFC